ncbi:carboxypeptidase-like regulatory domain-containing protein [Pedobacter sp. R20-19]|uniref:carboxypeptidase-like regulatory domain-containing protein n=1 Tax=Pedobacter sp. R20-19 TaxID=1270196 RepID=UPI000493A75C|nr:carboxypeptidase-like regulatory domain-containing protein [Pedobacter sp. R20-19]
MKNSTAQVTIAEHCTQNWDKMEKRSDFGFCTACSKNVIDFTNYTNAEIISVLTQASTSICGRLTVTQLNQLNHYLLVKPANRNWMKYLGVLAIGVSIFAQDASAALPLVATEIVVQTAGKKDDKKPNTVNRISGVVLGLDKKPMSGIRVVILNTKYHAITDEEGRYEFIFKYGLDLKSNVLSVESARFSATMTLDYNKVKQNDLTLQQASIIMGKVIMPAKKLTLK